MKRRIVGGVVAIGILAALVFVVANLYPEEAGACTSVSAQACQPYLQLVRKDLGADAGQIRQIVSHSWCGKKTCPGVFGGDPGFVLVVTLADGEAKTYRCSSSWVGSTTTPEGQELISEPSCSR